MREDLRELWQYRELLIILVQRDLKVRYKNSVFGFGWSLINPLVQVLTIAVVIQFISSVKTPNYHAYLFCATLPWLYFSTAIMDSCNSLLTFYNVIRKTYFPRELIPIATVIANFIHFLLATGVFLVYMMLLPLAWWPITGQFEWPLLRTALLIPLPMLGLTFLVTGIAMAISVWTLYFEDVRFLADSGLKILYWLVPVLWYPEMLLHTHLAGKHVYYTICMLNPLAAFITAFKKLTLVQPVMPPLPGHAPDSGIITKMGGSEWLFLWVAVVTSFGVLLAGHRYFNSRKWTLAERG